jgi:PhnB protein
LSKQSVAPYINFQGRAREAMEFYHAVFGGKLELYARDANGAPKPATDGDPIMHAQLESDGLVIIASDGHPSYPVQVGDNVAIVFATSDREHALRTFDALAAGGKVKMGITDMPWGAAGWMADKFGINWNFDVHKS